MTVRLLCDAIPFCYGPAAALETFLRSLFSISAAGFDVDVLASGSTLELLERARLPVRLLPVDSEDPADLATVPFESYAAFLNVCNPVSFDHARSRGTRVAYLDFLLWMHSGPAPSYFDADLYLAENYPGTSQWVETRGRELSNLRLIPPVIRAAVRSDPCPGYLLVGLGGLYSRLTQPGVNTNYASFVIESVLDVLPRDRFSRVLIAGPEGIADSTRRMIGNRAGVDYASLAHEAFVDELSRAEVFLSHPGLYAAFEAMLGGVPTAFLPPSNYTQILQLRHYRTAGLADMSFSWADAGLPEIPDGLPEADGVRSVLAVLDEAEASASATADFLRFLAGVFDSPPASFAELGRRQHGLAARFGKEGAQVAAETFVEWLHTADRRQA